MTDEWPDFYVPSLLGMIYDYTLVAVGVFAVSLIVTAALKHARR